VKVAVIGSGFAGLGMAIRLKQMGISDFVVLERAGEVGGTWRDNTYPGAACDVPSHLYSFSFAPNPDWSSSFSPQAEIQDYLRRTTDDFGIRPHLRLGAEVRHARWDDARERWHIDTTAPGARGVPEKDVYDAQFLVSATGALSDPSLPDLPGLDRFAGTTFHSARWRHDHDLSGERVAVIGTGASAIQFVPQIQPRVGQLSVFQRTPPWIVPRWDRRFTRPERWMFRHLPVTQRLARTGIYWSREAYVFGFAFDPRLMKTAELVARAHLRRQVPDPELRARLTPDYTIGCKRILISNDYLPALSQPNVDLVTTGITEVRERSIVTADGRERPVDTIIFGTGFHVTDMPIASRLAGRDGVVLADHWREGAHAHRGTTTAGFPNLFMLVGPNTGLGHTSQVFMIESQINYVADALRSADARGAATVEVRPAAEAAWNARVQADMEGTVWTSGQCASWYLDAAGRNTTLWPSFTFRFRRETRRFDPAAYHFGPPAVAGGPMVEQEQVA
jgi:cation diffusion facilitator CzcD-associated flavoprotein CzcO